MAVTGLNQDGGRGRGRNRAGRMYPRTLAGRFPRAECQTHPRAHTSARLGAQ